MLCPVCRSRPAGCLSTCTLCKECWRVPEECDCSSRDISTAAPTQQTASMSGGNMKEPPIYPSASIQGDRKKLTQYIAALKLWVKVSGVEAKNQANVVKYNAYQNSPEYFEELDSKFGETLADKEDGVDQIIKYLEDAKAKLLK